MSRTETKKGCDSSDCSPLDLALHIKRLDIVQLLVISGANSIDANPDLEKMSGVPTFLDEYYHYGTNEYISWLLNDHLYSHKITQFIEKVMKLDIYNEHGLQMFRGVGRHPAHALLTCGNEYVIREFLQSMVRKTLLCMLCMLFNYCILEI